MFIPSSNSNKTEDSFIHRHGQVGTGKCRYNTQTIQFSKPRPHWVIHFTRFKAYVSFTRAAGKLQQAVRVEIRQRKGRLGRVHQELVGKGGAIEK